MWDLPGTGLEPMSPALAGGFLTTAPLGKPLLFIFIAKYSLAIQLVWKYHNLYIHSPADGHLDCFQFLAITNKTAMNIYI